MNEIVKKIAVDTLNQVLLYKNLGKPAMIAVYVARQHLKPVVEEMCALFNARLGMSVTRLADLQRILNSHLRIVVDVWVKPEPHPEQANHLLLTVGGITAIIFDYTEHTQ